MTVSRGPFPIVRFAAFILCAVFALPGAGDETKIDPHELGNSSEFLSHREQAVVVLRTSTRQRAWYCHFIKDCQPFTEWELVSDDSSHAQTVQFTNRQSRGIYQAHLLPPGKYMLIHATILESAGRHKQRTNVKWDAVKILPGRVEFVADSGHVTYLGDLQMDLLGGDIRFSVNDDQAMAQAYLDATFPELASTLQKRLIRVQSQ